MLLEFTFEVYTDSDSLNFFALILAGKYWKCLSAGYCGTCRSNLALCVGEGKVNNAIRFNTRKLVLLALLTGLVIVLQFLGAFIRFGTFSISAVLIPIVIGAALMGVFAGLWLGLVFGFVVLATGDAAPFLAIDPVAAIVIVLGKGAFAGLAAGAVYKLLAVKNRTVAAVAAGVVCPVVNTGIMVVGCYAFFLPTLAEWGMAAGFVNATAFIFIGMIGLNFLFELGLNIILSPAIVRLIQLNKSIRQNTA